MSNPINPDYPVQAIESVDQLMDIAVAMEGEAARRYEQLARRTEGSGPPELVTLFHQLAQLERDHERGLETWARREGRRAPLAAKFSWRLPETFGDEADERPLDPYQALTIAVRNEERAFAFYSYLAALCAGGEELRLRAESLAREELSHVAMLRNLRRRAYHTGTTAASPIPVTCLADLQRLAAGLDAGSRQVDRLLPDYLAASLLRVHGDDAPAADETLQGPASEGVEAARRAELLTPDAITPTGAIALAQRDAQQVLETYLTIADRPADQAVLAEAQRLAERALARLTLLRADGV